MSWIATAAVKLHTVAETPTQLLVMFLLADISDDVGRSYPSVATIALWAHCSDRTIRRTVHDLAELGELQIEERQRGNGSATSNRYTLTPGGSKVTEVGCQIVRGPLPPVPPPEQSEDPEKKEERKFAGSISKADNLKGASRQVQNRQSKGKPKSNPGTHVESQYGPNVIPIRESKLDQLNRIVREMEADGE